MVKQKIEDNEIEDFEPILLIVQNVKINVKIL